MENFDILKKRGFFSSNKCYRIIYAHFHTLFGRKKMDRIDEFGANLSERILYSCENLTILRILWMGLYLVAFIINLQILLTCLPS